jgi:hypothetical protein
MNLQFEKQLGQSLLLTLLTQWFHGMGLLSSVLWA